MGHRNKPEARWERSRGKEKCCSKNKEEKEEWAQEKWDWLQPWTHFMAACWTLRERIKTPLDQRQGGLEVSLLVGPEWSIASLRESDGSPRRELLKIN